MVVQVEVQQVDVPRRLDRVRDIALDDLPGDGQRRILRVVMDVPVPRPAQLRVLLCRQPVEQFGCERISGLHPARHIVSGEARPLVKPFPEDAETDLARGHVLHEVELILVAEVIGRFKRRRLESTSERVAVLEGDRQQVACPAHRARGGLEQHQIVGVLLIMGERREGASQLVGGPGLLPDRSHDGNHLPVRHPLAAGTPLLLAFAAGERALHAERNALRRSDRDVGLHAALPDCKIAVAVGCVDRTPYAILVNPHVAVLHGDGVGVGVQEVPVPGHGVRNAVDVVPSTGVEADEAAAERGPDFHQLVAGFELLD